MSKRRLVEIERCDTCGEPVGFYDDHRPEGEKIIITRNCECVRQQIADRKKHVTPEAK